MAEPRNNCDWVIAQIRELQGQDAWPGGSAYAQFMSRTDWDCLGMYASAMSAQVMRELYVQLSVLLDPRGYACCVYRVHGSAHNYAYAYWPAGREVGDPAYVCVQHTFESMDGEYRTGLLPYTAFARAYAGSAGTAELESLVGARLNDPEHPLVLERHCLPDTPAVQAASEAGRLPVRLLAAHLSAMYVLQHHAPEARHATRGSADTFEALAGEVRLPAPPPNPFDAIYHESVRLIRVGQKIVPLHELAAYEPGNLRFAAWREVRAMQLATDLAVNLLAPCYPIYRGWTYLHSAAALFENQAMLDAYARSDITRQAAAELRAGQARLERLAAPEAQRLAARTAAELLYAQATLELSPYAALHAMEDVGFTLANWGTAFAYTRARRCPRALLDLFAQEDLATGLAFCLLYGVHVLHERAHLLHTDLHANNITMQVGRQALVFWGSADAEQPARGQPATQPAAGASALFVLGPRGERDSFLFPSRLVYPKIIDYSRAVFGPAAAVGAQPPAFWAEQDERVRELIARHAGGDPALVPGLERLAEQRQAAFDALRLADVGAAARSLRLLLEEVGGTPRAAALLAAAEAAAAAELRAALGALCAGRPPRGPRTAALLARLFAPWRWTPRAARGAVLVEAYSAAGAAPWSCWDSARAPPWLSAERFESPGNPFIRYVDRGAARAHLATQVPVAVERAAPPADKNALL